MRSMFGKWAAALRRRRVKAEKVPSSQQIEEAEETSVAGQHCLNCEAPLTGAYCHQCGQKDDDLRRPVWTFFRELMDAIFGADSKILKTIFLLILVPGGLTRAFMMGRRARFLPPLRLYVVLSFVFFITLSLADVLILDINVEPKAARTTVSESTEKSPNATTEATQEAKPEIASPQLNPLVDNSIGEQLVIAPAGDTSEQTLTEEGDEDARLSKGLIGQLVGAAASGNRDKVKGARNRIRKILDRPNNELSDSDRQTLEQVMAIDIDELENQFDRGRGVTVDPGDFPYDVKFAMFIPDQHQARSGLKQEDIDKILSEEDTPEMVKLAFTGFAKALKNPREFNELFNDWLPWAMVILMPVFALILRAFHWGGRRYYLNQLVFALHFHSFLFVLLTGFVLLVPVYGDAHAIQIFWGVTSLYLIVALKVGEDQGWIRAFLKAGFIWVGYFFFMMSTMMGVMFWGLQDI